MAGVIATTFSSSLAMSVTVRPKISEAVEEYEIKRDAIPGLIEAFKVAASNIETAATPRFDGERLVMTDGSEKLFFRDPVTFDLIGEIRVTQSGTPIALLNELECIDGKVWANVYRTDFIIRIDPDTGFVDGIVDAASLEQPRVQPTEVLNGIAWDAETDTWLVTGKFWPTMYRVRFVSDGITN